jgi:hypothetical protein
MEEDSLTAFQVNLQNLLVETNQLVNKPCFIYFKYT